MPELPEVETIRRGLEKDLVGASINAVTIRRTDLRVPISKNLSHRLIHQTITALRRRAKYLLLDLANGTTLVIHLGMSGRLLLQKDTTPCRRHDHVVLTLRGSDGVKKTLVFHDPRRFGMMILLSTDTLPTHPLFVNLGVEPLEDAFTAAWCQKSFANRRVALKLVLMDQRLVVGIGNIYASESLFHARLDPRRLAKTLDENESERLVNACRHVLNRAIAAGGSSVRDYVHTDGTVGGFQKAFAVYGRVGQACPECVCDVVQTGGIVRIVHQGRSTFWCPRVQEKAVF